MARDKNLTIKINAKTKEFDDALKQARKQTASLEKNLKSLTKKSAIGFAAVTAAVTLTGLAFAKFQKDFTQVVTLLDKSSFATKSLKDGIKDLEKGVLDLRAASGESFEDLNKGLFNLISAGIPAEEAINSLAIATNLAAAGGTNVAVAVDAITTSINAFGLKASDAERVSQLFFLAQKNGKTTVEELANSMGVAASSANSFGVSLEEVLAATAATTLAGKSTSQALTGLNQVFANIAKPTKDAADEAARLGVQFDTAALRAKGLEGFLNDIVNAEGFTSASIEKLFGSVEAMGVAFALTGEQNEAFTNTLRQLQNEAKLAETFNKALAEANSTVDKSLAKLGGSLQAVNVALGKEFAPLIIAVSEKLTTFAKFILNADSGILKITKNVILFIGAVTGLTTALGTLGIAVIAVRNGLTAMGISGAAAWKKILLPATAAIAAYTALRITIEKVGAAFGISAETSEKSLKRIKDKILDLRDAEQKLEDKIKNGFAFRREANIAKLADLQKEIAQSEALQAVIQREVDLRNEVNITKSTPLAAEGEGKKDGSKKSPVDTGRTDAIINEKAREVDLKIEQAKREAAVLREIREGATEEELQAIRERNALLAEEDSIKLENELLNAELRTTGITEQRETEIEKQLELNGIELENLSEQQELIREAEEEKRLSDQEANDLVREIEREQRINFTEEDLAALKDHLTRRKLTTDKFLLNAVKKKKKDDAQFLKDVRTSGLAVAKINKFFRSQEAAELSKGLSNLSTLRNASSKKAQRLGKAAAIAETTINTFKSATSSFAALAGIPIVGPVLGAAAAAAAIAAGFVQIQNIQSTPISGAIDGGLVSGGVSGKDTEPFMLSKGESIIPADITPALLDTFRDLRNIRDSGGILNTLEGAPDLQPRIQTNTIINQGQALVRDFEEGEPQEINILVGLEDDATDLLTARQRENNELSIGVI